MKRKLLIFALVLLTVFNVATLATFAYHRWSIDREMHQFPPHGDDLKPFRELGLDSTQLAAIQDARERFQDETGDLNARMFELQQRMFDEMHADQPDTTAVFALVDSIGVVQKSLHRMAIMHMMNEGSILTKEQRSELFSKFRNQMDRRWERRGGMHRGGGRHRSPFGMNRPDEFGPHDGHMGGPGMGMPPDNDSQFSPNGNRYRMNDRTDVTNRNSESNRNDSSAAGGGNQGGN